jgi:arabinogalactan oligomer/maltooligosaccharide transport system substrate-binding protein
MKHLLKLSLTQGVLLGLTAFSLFTLGCPSAAKENQLTIWTVEGELDGAYQYVQGIIDEYLALNEAFNPGLEINLENKPADTLREDFATASLANNPPDILWTVSDHVGPFVDADLILALEEEIDPGKYIDGVLETVTLDQSLWALPVNNGNHLMLMYNRDLLPTPPQNTDELIALGRDLSKGERVALVFDQTQPFWLVPWLGGFSGKVFLEDGVTPDLNSPEMIQALTFIQELKFVHGLIPTESGYNAADTLFKEEKAAMIINGDWALGEYISIFGDKLGVARIPMISETGLWPSPFTSGKFLMFAKDLAKSPIKKALALDFADFVTNLKNQQDLVYYLNRLPATVEAFENELSEDPFVTELLIQSADQMSVGTPMPAVTEMRYAWDSMRPWMAKVLNGTATPREAALGMQQDVESILAVRK